MIHTSNPKGKYWKEYCRDAWRPVAYRLEMAAHWAEMAETRVEATAIGTEEKKRIMLNILAGSFWERSAFEAGSVVVVLQHKKAGAETEKVVYLIVSERFVKNLRRATDAETAYANLLSLPQMAPLEQEIFTQFVTGGKRSVGRSRRLNLRGMELRAFYRIIQPFLPQGPREVCDGWAAQIPDKKATEKMQMFLSISPDAPDRDRGTVTKESILAVLDREILGCEELKETLSSFFAQKVRRISRRGVVILLHGLPGTGKTHLAEVLAEALQLPYKRIDLGTVSSTATLLGCESLYTDSANGVPIDFFSTQGTSETVLVLDEIDKLARSGTDRGKDGQVIESLLPLLDRSAPRLCDTFLDGIPVDCSNTVFVLTANRTDNLPPELLNRCDIVSEMLPMEDAVLHTIVRKKAAEQAAEHELPDNWLSEAAEKTMLSYRGDFGARDAVSFVDTLSLLALRSPEALPLTAEAAEAELQRFANGNSFVVRFHRNEASYPPAQRKDILDAVSRRMGSSNLSEQERRSLDLRADYLTRLLHKPPTPFDRETFYAYIKERLYGCAEVTDAIAADLYAADVHGIKPGRKLFLGPPGVGKSVFCEAIGAATGRKYVRIQMNGITQPEDIRGLSPCFTAATAGTFFKGLVDGGSTTAILYFDEIDKIPHQVAVALLDVLDDSGKLYNMFTESWIDISDALICASANDISGVDPALLSRFEIVEMNGYSALEKREIAERHLLPEITRSAAVAFEPEAFDAVLSRYETEAGVRSVKHGLKSVVQRCLLKQSDDPAGVRIRREDVENILGPAPYRYIAGSEPGCVNGLATLSGARGLVMPIRVTLLESGKRRITGLPEETVRDSVAVAETWVEKLGYSLEGGFHIHFAPAGVKKDGPSAGVAAAVALLSAVTGVPVTDAAFTGEFDGERVLPVGGLKLKIQAAKSAGIHTVYLPAACRGEIDEMLFGGMNLHYVSTIGEIVKERFPQLSRFAAR